MSSYLFTLSFPSSTGLRRGGWQATGGMSGMIATLSPDMTENQNTAAAGNCAQSLEVSLQNS